MKTVPCRLPMVCSLAGSKNLFGLLFSFLDSCRVNGVFVVVVVVVFDFLFVVTVVVA